MKENYNIKRETDYVILSIYTQLCVCVVHVLSFERPLT